MNHRQRVLAALRHEEPDRVPLDLGATGDTGILPAPYRELRRRLGMQTGRVRLCNTLSQCVYVEDDLRRCLGVDAAGIYYQPARWQEGPLEDGWPASYPAGWSPVTRPGGDRVILDASGRVTFRMPAGSPYFDPVYFPLAGATSVQEIERGQEWLENFDRPAYLDKSYEELAAVAQDLYEHTDYLLVGFFGGHILQGGNQLRGWEQFLVDLASGSPLADAVMTGLVEGHMRRFARFAETVGKYVQVVHVEDDLGMQDRSLLSPRLYRQRVKPYHQRLYAFIKQHCPAYLMLHTDGAVYPLLPDFVEMGVDVLNPVQYSAAGMDTARLKAEFGRDLVFWGGGCDTQQVLPFATPSQVRDEVRRRIADLAPGGGFVFSQVHNIQPGTPAENLAAMYQALADYGSY